MHYLWTRAATAAAADYDRRGPRSPEESRLRRERERKGTAAAFITRHLYALLLFFHVHGKYGTGRTRRIIYILDRFRYSSGPYPTRIRRRRRRRHRRINAARSPPLLPLSRAAAARPCRAVTASSKLYLIHTIIVMRVFFRDKSHGHRSHPSSPS